jgi:hypothetical protein
MGTSLKNKYQEIKNILLYILGNQGGECLDCDCWYSDTM